MQTLKELVASSGFNGELDDSAASKEKYSHASLFEIKPQLVVFPKDTKDVETLVKLALSTKAAYKDLSLTPRSGARTWLAAL